LPEGPEPLQNLQEFFGANKHPFSLINLPGTNPTSHSPNVLGMFRFEKVGGSEKVKS